MMFDSRFKKLEIIEKAMSIISERDAEIERLEKQLHRAECFLSNIRGMCNDVLARAAEKYDYVSDIVDVLRHSDTVVTQNLREKAADEIERLRAALKAILEDPEAGVNITLYARTALKGKE